MNDKSEKNLLRTALILSIITIVYNVAEGIISTLFGYTDDTLALLGFGIDSFVEVISGIGIFHLVWRMQRSPIEFRDKFEKQALAITGISFFLLTAGLIIGSIINILNQNRPETTIPGIIISLVSILTMWFLYKVKLDTGYKLKSDPIIADAYCTKTCFYLSFILLLSSIFYMLFRINYIDIIGGLGIAYFALGEGKEAMEKSRKDDFSCSCGEQETRDKPKILLKNDSCCSEPKPILLKTAEPCSCSGGEDKSSGMKTNKPPHWVTGTIDTPAGQIYQTTSQWTWPDYRGRILSRISSYRMDYSVNPGLYAIGEPDKNSHVLVSANYKLSFDILRRELKGMNAWILVLDTKGINVWCAAGKGTFGTAELSSRINAAGLAGVVKHRKIIVPQLGAVGVNAREVKNSTGFRVYFGPVEAKDIPAYIGAGLKATAEMRLIKFSMIKRLVLTPMELVPAFQKSPLIALAIFAVFGLGPDGILFKDAWHGGLSFVLLLVLAVISGAFVTPLFLPFIPFRSFAVKGWISGMGLLLLVDEFQIITVPGSLILKTASYIFYPLLSSYIALQFTGATAFTGISGVKKELKYSLPVYIGGSAVSIILLILYKLFQWRVI